MWEVDFLMPEALPDDMVASADAYAYVDTFYEKLLASTTSISHILLEKPFGSEQIVGS